MTRFPVCLLSSGLPVLLTLLLAPLASAQTAAPVVSPYITVNLGLVQPTPKALTSVATFSDGFDRDQIRMNSTMKRSPVFDLGGGVVIRDRWVLGASFDRSTESAPADVALTLDHPGFHPMLTASRVTDSLERVETGLHINLGYKVPIGDSLSLTIFGGPSYLTRRQELLSDVSISEPFNPTTRTFSAVINSVDTRKVRSSAWGYNVGADASYFMSRHVGVGGQIRYARATFDTENFLQSEIDGRTATDLVDGGGLRLAAGVRLRF